MFSGLKVLAEEAKPVIYKRVVQDMDAAVFTEKPVVPYIDIVHNRIMMDCKKALAATDGDKEKAIDFLREKGIAKAEKKAGRIASEGVVAAYVSDDAKLAAVVEVNCETDFVANTDNFHGVHFAGEPAAGLCLDLDGAHRHLGQRYLCLFYRFAAGPSQALPGNQPEQDHRRICRRNHRHYAVGDRPGGTVLFSAAAHEEMVTSLVRDEVRSYKQLPLMMVPAPATAELLKGIPSYHRGDEKEMTTPTGAAVVKALAEFAENIPADFVTERIAYGAGFWELSLPNVLRLYLGEYQGKKESCRYLIEANIDDMSGQLFGYASEQLLAAGALDVWTTPIFMRQPLTFRRPAPDLPMPPASLPSSYRGASTKRCWSSARRLFPST